MTLQELDAIRYELREGPPRLRRERAVLWIPVLDDVAQSREHRLAQVAANYREALETRTGLETRPSDQPHVDPGAALKARWVRIAGLAIVGIETILAVGVSVWSLTLWPLISGLIGGFIAIGWTLGSLGVHYGRSESACPAAGLRTARLGVWLSFLVSLLGLVPLLLARTVPDAATFTGVATAVISLGFSSLAAYLFCLAFLIDWAAPYAREHERLERELLIALQLCREAKEISAGRLPIRPSWEEVFTSRRRRVR